MTRPTGAQGLTLADLYPTGTFFCGRTTREVMAWNLTQPDVLADYRLDATPGQRLGVMGPLPFICHEASITPGARAFLDDCGLTGPACVETYQTEQDARDNILQMQATGAKLAYNFGTLPGCDADDGLLVPTQLYNRFNSKMSLAELVPAQHLPSRRLTSVAGLDNFRLVRPAYVKMAGLYSNGGGGAVRYCTSQADLNAIAREFDARLPADCPVVVEDELPDCVSWCAGVAVQDAATVFLGASRQIFGAPGRQAGNVIDALETPPELVHELSIKIARRARSLGLAGIAGFDMLVNRDGDVIVVDLNFRPNASTSLLLTFDGASKRSGKQLARSLLLRSSSSLENVLLRLRSFAAKGLLIPDCLFDAGCYHRHVPNVEAETCIDGWVMADSEVDAVNLAAELQRIVADP